MLYSLVCLVAHTLESTATVICLAGVKINWCGPSLKARRHRNCFFQAWGLER